ncbi:hypothetical protein B0T24DRAFT_635563 [Lasiosphaeria ovina]|uniref:Secreted protein n=1 Tax=Lasiosphaeria ovina TaxID=92902 RepID=A0AAE0N1J8_9PEZI|nr:hypothetical protein B0T24DRAFT_635563 [Lasiosphaeria ovina]
MSLARRPSSRVLCCAVLCCAVLSSAPCSACSPLASKLPEILIGARTLSYGCAQAKRIRLLHGDIRRTFCRARSTEFGTMLSSPSHPALISFSAEVV